MKYYITADIHGFYTEFHKVLDEAGYFTDPVTHKLIIRGDIFDRGLEAVEMQQFILQLMEKGDVILVRGNHEDLCEEKITIDEGPPFPGARLNPHPTQKQRLYTSASTFQSISFLFALLTWIKALLRFLGRFSFSP